MEAKLLCLIVVMISHHSVFPFPNIPVISIHRPTTRHPFLQSAMKGKINSFPDDSNTSAESMRNEIDRMKLEALERLTALDDTISGRVRSSSVDTESQLEVSATSNQTEDAPLDSEATHKMVRLAVDELELLGGTDDSDDEDSVYIQRIAVSNDPTLLSSVEASPIMRTSEAIARREISLLDSTRWKIALNIGREEGG